jgi:putative SOS response-associated peptidase YedK
VPSAKPQKEMIDLAVQLVDKKEEWKRNTHAHPMINARLETAAEKPMFSSSFRARHCLVLADGYYEWKTLPTARSSRMGRRSPRPRNPMWSARARRCLPSRRARLTS